MGRLALALWSITFVLASLFAWRTPIWQAPDEPAHYAYVAHVATHGSPPTLIDSCYDERYIVRLRSTNFVEAPDLDRFCYEGHQPPLFYYLAAPIYLLGGGSLLLLRLFAAALGAMTVPLARAIVRAGGGGQGVALAVAGVVALVPQHLAIIGSFNNDALTFPIVALALWQMIRLLRDPSPAPREWLALGVVLGIALLVKTLAWVVLPVAAATLLLARRPPDPPTRLVRRGAATLGVAALFILPWLGRNVLTYPGLDLLGLERHDQIAVGQPRTATRVAELGVWESARSGIETTFNSFWGQFGWMKAPLQPDEYQLLAAVTLVALLGLLLWIGRRGWRGWGIDGRVVVLLALWLGVNLSLLIYYNLEFVQYQGRYLFPSLTAWAFFLVVGLGAWLPPRLRPLPWGLLLLFLLYLDGLAIVERLPGMLAY